MRQKLPQRRPCEHFGFQCNGLSYTASIGRLEGRVLEIFISNSKAGSHSDAACKDASIVASIALQYGVPVEVIKHALLRDANGVASSPLGAAIDRITKDSPP